MRSVIGLALLILHINSCASHSIKGPERHLCSEEQQLVFSAALKESLDPSNPRLPDYEIASRHSSIYVLDTVRKSECIVDDNVLPKFPGASIRLVQQEQLHRLARRNGGKLAYLQLSSIGIEQNIARVWLGVSIKLADKDKGPSLCCCGGEMILKSVDLKWTFDAWGLRVCA